MLQKKKAFLGFNQANSNGLHLYLWYCTGAPWYHPKIWEVDCLKLLRSNCNSINVFFTTESTFILESNSKGRLKLKQK